MSISAQTSTSAMATTTTKEKRGGWFHSLTRKKSHSQTSLTPHALSAPTAAAAATTNARDDDTTAAGAAAATEDDSIRNNNNNNNNNEEPNASHSSSTCPQRATTASPPAQAAANSVECNATVTAVAAVASRRKRKDEKNVLQRFAKRIGLRFHSLRRNHTSEDDDGIDAGGGATTDASGEFVTQTSRLPPAESATLTFKFAAQNELSTLVDDDPNEMVPFTRDYHRFIVKKWLEGESGPNCVMYTACSEMLGQVWYWGEISRRNAQRVLTDKPTGSFLVRDSESSGSQFTLSFRIVNVTLHYRIEHRENYWHFEELQYESIVEMIEDILRRCTNDNFICFVRVPNEMQPPFPVILKYPLSRYFQMPPLQDLCRRVIQRNITTSDEINQLPVPTKLIEYLNEKRELVF